MTPDPCTAATHQNINNTSTLQPGAAECTRLLLAELTDRRQLVLDLQDDPFTHVLQQTDDLIVSELGQVDAVDRPDIVAHVQLVTPEQTAKTSALILLNQTLMSSFKKRLFQKGCC